MVGMEVPAAPVPPRSASMSPAGAAAASGPGAAPGIPGTVLGAVHGRAPGAEQPGWAYCRAGGRTAISSARTEPAAIVSPIKTPLRNVDARMEHSLFEIRSS